MPLEKGDSPESMGSNYKTLTAEGKPRAQKIAIMLRQAGKSEDQHAESCAPVKPQQKLRIRLKGQGGQAPQQAPKTPTQGPPQANQQRLSIVLQERQAGHSLREIGKQLGVSGERVRQLQQEATRQ